MALLPVETVIVHTMLEGMYISSGALDRKNLTITDYRSLNQDELQKLFRILCMEAENNKKVIPLEYTGLPNSESKDGYYM